MGRFLIVSKADRLDEYMQISREYDVSLEINDFFAPELLDDEKRRQDVTDAYRALKLPEHSTVHGAFLDISIGSRDKKIREISRLRMTQSMELAQAIGAEGVVFHTNYNPGVPGKQYKEHLIAATAEYLTELLEQYPEIRIYMENMFETQPEILREISKQLKAYANYGVCLDWAHVNVYGTNPAQWLEELKPYIRHIHINDNDLESDLHLPVGSGRIDWEYFFSCYRQDFMNCSVLVETTEPDGQRRSLDYIREKFPYI